MSVLSLPANATPDEVPAVAAEADVELTYSRREEPEDWESVVNVAKLTIRE